MIGIKYELPSTAINLFMGDFDLGLYMCDFNDTQKEVDLSDGIIVINSEI